MNQRRQSSEKQLWIHYMEINQTLKMNQRRRASEIEWNSFLGKKCRDCIEIRNGDLSSRWVEMGNVWSFTLLPLFPDFFPVAIVAIVVAYIYNVLPQQNEGGFRRIVAFYTVEHEHPAADSITAIDSNVLSLLSITLRSPPPLATDLPFPVVFNTSKLSWWPDEYFFLICSNWYWSW